MLTQTMTQCDIILPVYNGLLHVEICLQALLTCTEATDYHLYIIDDASDMTTRRFLREQTNRLPQVTLHKNKENVGFVRSCNTGIALGKAPYVLLLNTDVIVTPQWLTRLLACAHSDDKIASVNPLTNQAAQIDLPLAPGANFYDMDWTVRQRTPDYPDVVTGVGFCLLLRRTALEHVGLLDEIYGQGYCEESDLCMRLTTQGYRTVVADNVYVYHQGQASFTHSLARYQHNRRLFDNRWRHQYHQQFRDFCKANPLKRVRQLFALPQRWTPLPALWTNYRCLLKSWRQRQWLNLGLETVRGMRRLYQARTPIPDPTLVTAITRPDRLCITYLLDKLVISGGVLSVIQLVNALILQGVTVRIATLFVDPAIQAWRLLTGPLVFKTAEELVDRLPQTDIVVATHWHTATWAAELVKTRRATRPVYYLQDYESWFYPATAQTTRAQVNATYALIAHKIVTSEWLKTLLAEIGYPETHKICIGTDLTLFYPRDVPRSQHPVIITMARPGTPWRGFSTVIAALKQIKQVLPATEVILFGDNQLFKQKIPFEYRDEGVVTRQETLAALYSEADVFIDGSDHQGFGRPALEAMACGSACVLTGIGGVMEYARNDDNCLLVPPQHPQKLTEAVLNILHHPHLQEKLVQGGLKTAQQFSLTQEVQETLDYFNRLAALK